MVFAHLASIHADVRNYHPTTNRIQLLTFLVSSFFPPISRTPFYSRAPDPDPKTPKTRFHAILLIPSRPHDMKSNMFDRLLRQQTLPPTRPPAFQTDPQRRPHDIIEQKRAVNEQHEAEDLQPFERLPAQRQRDEPDEEGAAGIDGGAGGGADGAGDGEAEEVEASFSTPFLSVCLMDGTWI